MPFNCTFCNHELSLEEQASGSDVLSVLLHPQATHSFHCPQCKFDFHATPTPEFTKYLHDTERE